MRLAGAPISWGVSASPDWGIQLSAERVLDEMQALGLTATEAGPPGFLPSDSALARPLLASHRLQLVGGFVTAVLHVPGRRAEELARVERRAKWLADVGAEVLVLAASTGATGYTRGEELDDPGWRDLFDSLDGAADIAAHHHLTLAIHPHWGTAIERTEHVDRFLSECEHGLCLDTGHLALGGADVLAVADRAGARLAHVHLKDLDDALGQAVRAGDIVYADAVGRGLFRPLGEGIAKISVLLARLQRHRYQGWYVLEQDVVLRNVPDGQLDTVKPSLTFVRDLEATWDFSRGLTDAWAKSHRR